MKKILIAGAFLAGMSNMAMAASDTGPGCGAGSILFSGQTGIVPHVLAATTNGILGNQTFGMSTGTLGCDVDQPISNPAATAFLNSNMEKVARDMSVGEGESLDALATLMNISDADKPAFFAAMKDNFVEIYSHDAITGDDVMASINGVMSRDAALAQYIG